MSLAHIAVAAIGWSHLLQPPVTLWLAKRVLGLASAFAALPSLANRIAHVMAVTAITLPTMLGVLCAMHPDAVLSAGAMRLVAFLLAGVLWTPRLFAQLFWIGPMFPIGSKKIHLLLVTIFAAQGPAFLAVLLAGAK
jgi:hypothetical protein